MTVQDYINMNDHSKKTIYEAYSLYYAKVGELVNTLKQTQRDNAKVRYERDFFKDVWLREHITNHVEVAGDKEDAINHYFKDSTRQLWLTEDMGYYCTIELPDCIFIVFAWGNRKAWRRESKNMPQLLKYMSEINSKPIRWTGIKNVLSRHSKQIEENLWELCYNSQKD